MSAEAVCGVNELCAFLCFIFGVFWYLGFSSTLADCGKSRLANVDEC